MMSRFAVIVCSACRHARAVDLRHQTAACARCHDIADLRVRRRYWQGDSARDAQQATAGIQAALDQGLDASQAQQAVAAITLPDEPPRHDSPVDAAAAKARPLVNKGRRAEAVMLWLTRLIGNAPHDQAVDALGRAGIDRDRAEKEILRMLACDVIYEPKAGAYRTLDS